MGNIIPWSVEDIQIDTWPSVQISALIVDLCVLDWVWRKVYFHET
jgi:hypothetical protein